MCDTTSPGVPAARLDSAALCSALGLGGLGQPAVLLDKPIHRPLRRNSAPLDRWQGRRESANQGVALQRERGGGKGVGAEARVTFPHQLSTACSKDSAPDWALARAQCRSSLQPVPAPAPSLDAARRAEERHQRRQHGSRRQQGGGHARANRCRGGHPRSRPGKGTLQCRAISVLGQRYGRRYLRPWEIYLRSWEISPSFCWGHDKVYFEAAQLWWTRKLALL